MKARIEYCPSYNDKEGYIVEIYVNGEWSFDSFFPLVRREKATTSENCDFVHYSILNKIRDLQELGYTISII